MGVEVRFRPAPPFKIFTSILHLTCLFAASVTALGWQPVSRSVFSFLIASRPSFDSYRLVLLTTHAGAIPPEFAEQVTFLPDDSLLYQGSFQEMARGKRQSYIVFVVEDGRAVKQWAIRVDRLLSCLALGVLLSLSPLIVPLMRGYPPQTRPSAPLKQMLNDQAPGSGQYDLGATRTLLATWLGVL